VFPVTFFDYNGVLVDDEHVHLAAFREVLEPLGVGVTDAEYFDRYIGYDDAGSFRAILSDAGRPPTDADVRALIEAKRPLYLARANAELRGFPGAGECIRRRAASGKVAVVSGALRDEVVLGLHVLGVSELVELIVAAEDMEQPKPDPDGYLRATRKMAAVVGEAAARRALVIEDSFAGIEAAKAAGLACVAVAHTYPASELARAGADLVVDGITAVDETTLGDLYRRLHG
jgi:beta-phosphoglucomutase